MAYFTKNESMVKPVGITGQFLRPKILTSFYYTLVKELMKNIIWLKSCKHLVCVLCFETPGTLYALVVEI